MISQDLQGSSFYNIKMKPFYIFIFLEKGVEKEIFFSILRIRSDRGGEFINHYFITYCEENGIRHELSFLKFHNKME